MAKILLVDDNEELVQAVERALRRRGLESITTTTPIGVSAIVLREEPAVVVLDVMMPALDGGSLAQLIRTRTRERENKPQIIFYSAMDEEKLYRLTQQVEGATYVPKEDGVDALYAAICRAMGAGRAESGGRA